MSLFCFFPVLTSFGVIVFIFPSLSVFLLFFVFFSSCAFCCCFFTPLLLFIMLLWKEIVPCRSTLVLRVLHTIFGCLLGPVCATYWSPTPIPPPPSPTHIFFSFCFLGISQFVLSVFTPILVSCALFCEQKKSSFFCHLLSSFGYIFLY